MADLFKLVQLQEGSELIFEEIEMNLAEKLFFEFKNIIDTIQNKIVYL